MKEYNVESTAQAIDLMVKELNYRAVRLELIAKNMRSKGDLTYATEAVSEVTNMLVALDLDLLITRPLREVMKING